MECTEFTDDSSEFTQKDGESTFETVSMGLFNCCGFDSGNPIFVQSRLTLERSWRSACTDEVASKVVSCHLHNVIAEIAQVPVRSSTTC